MACHFGVNRNKNFLIPITLLSSYTKGTRVQANPEKGTAELSGWHRAPGAEGSGGVGGGGRLGLLSGNKAGGSTPTVTVTPA